MSPTNQSMLARFAVATSVFSLLMVAFVAAKGTDGGGGGQSVSTAPVAVELSEFAITPATVTVPQGGSVSITNTGSMDHNLGVTGTPILSATLGSGGTGTLDLSSLSPGTYEFFCEIAGHRDSGMVATLVITADGETGGAVDAHAGHDDIASLVPGSDLATRINQEMEQAMTDGVLEFLDFAEKYGNGEMKAGNEKIEPNEIRADGTKVFELTSAITDWQVEPGKIVKAWTYNERVPGPWIRIEPGDSVEVILKNDLPISTDVHWHGIDVPFDQDGVAPITQPYIRPGETYTYKWTAPDYPMLGMYHAHMHGHEAIVNGLFAVVQIGDMELPRGRTIAGLEVPADMEIAQEIPMVLNDAGVIGLSLNGKSFPETEPIVANKDDWILMHFYNEGLVGHPMHLHRQPHLVVAKDGFALDAPYRVDTVWISPGERYSILIKAELPGIWAFHCHVVTHAENADGFFGMVTVMIVNDPDGEPVGLLGLDQDD